MRSPEERHADFEHREVERKASFQDSKDGRAAKLAELAEREQVARDKRRFVGVGLPDQGERLDDEWLVQLQQVP